MRLIGTTVIAVFWLALLAAGCGRLNSSPAATPGSVSSDVVPGAPARVQVATVERGSLASASSYVGNVQARQQVSIVPKVAGRVMKLAVDVGSVVQAGEVVATLDDAALAVQLAQAEGGLTMAQAKLAGLEAGGRPEAVAQAKAALEVSRLKLQDLEAGGRAEQVAQAEATLKTALAKLQQVKDGPTPEQRRAAMQAVEGAKAQLDSVNVKKDGDCNKLYPEYLCNASKAAALAAAHNVDAAQAQYDALVAPPTSEQLDQALAAVDAAQAQYELAKAPYTPVVVDQARQALKQAEAQLSLTQTPVQEYDLAAARGAMAQAKAAVDLAQLQLADARLRAPLSGIISQRLVSEGAVVGPASPVLMMVSSDTVVVVDVDERTLAVFKAGQPASVTTNAYPGEQFSAIVTSVAPTVDARSRTGQVRLTPVDQAGKLRDGMFAQVHLAASVARQDALVVPKGAVLQDGQDTVVYAVADGRASRLVVTTGTSDGGQVEIVVGLSEGQLVATSGLSALRDGVEVTVQ